MSSKSTGALSLLRDRSWRMIERKIRDDHHHQEEGDEGGPWWEVEYSRWIIQSSISRVNTAGSQHQNPATVSPPIFQCLTVLPNILPLCDSFATICQWFVQQAPHPPGLLVGQLTPSTLAHCYAIFHCWLKSKYQWQRSSSWAIGWPPPYSKFSIFNIGKFNSFTIGWRGQRTALLRPFLSTLSHFQAPSPTFVTAFCDNFTLQCPHLWQHCPVPTINWQVLVLFSTIFNACACVVCSGNIESFSYSLNLSFAQLYIV